MKRSQPVSPRLKGSNGLSRNRALKAAGEAGAHEELRSRCGSDAMRELPRKYEYLTVAR